jgi:hypothetical protein
LLIGHSAPVLLDVSLGNLRHPTAHRAAPLGKAGLGVLGGMPRQFYVVVWERCRESAADGHSKEGLVGFDILRRADDDQRPLTPSRGPMSGFRLLIERSKSPAILFR